MTPQHFYLVPDAVMQAQRPRGGFQAHTCPDNPTLWLVGMNDWYDATAADDLESAPGVVPLNPEDHGQPAPQAMIAAMASWGARPGHTRRQVLTLARRTWPGFVL